MNIVQSFRDMINPARRSAHKKYSQMARDRENDLVFHIQSFWEYSGLNAEVHRTSHDRDLSVGSLRSCGVYYLMVEAVEASLGILQRTEDQRHREMIEAVSVLLNKISHMKAEHIISVKTFDLIHLAATLLLRGDSIDIGSLSAPLRDICLSLGSTPETPEGFDLLRRVTVAVKDAERKTALGSRLDMRH